MKIDIYADGNVPFNPEILWGKGLGGAEYAIVLLAEELGKSHEVTVWNESQASTKFDHVWYRPVGECDVNMPTDLFVIFRVSIPYRPANAKRVVFFSCDQMTDPYWSRMWPWLERFVCISKFHANYICQHYPIEASRLRICELGVNIPDYLEPEEKVHGMMIFCSVPHRGLAELFQMWPKIVDRIPEAHLVVTSDYTLWGKSNNPGNREFVDWSRRLEGVSFLGAVNRADLVRFQKRSELFPYPCVYEENFCLSAMECIAAGAIPIATRIGSLETTINGSGVLIDEAQTSDGQVEFVNELVSLYFDRERLESLRQSGMSRARRHYSYQATAKRFLEACLK